MPKTETIFVCSNCGNESRRWFGKCTSCNEWNTCYEEKMTKNIKSNNINNRTTTDCPYKIK